MKSITLPLRLRWKREDLSLSEAKLVRYRPADAADSLPEQVVVEFETKQARSNNLRVGFQLEQGSDKVSCSAELVQGEPSAAADPARKAGPGS